MAQLASIHAPAITTGHATYLPTTSVSGSMNVNIDGLPALANEHEFINHPSTTPPYNPHSEKPKITGGSSTVNINGKGAARIGDAVGCGDIVASGGTTVFIGG